MVLVACLICLSLFLFMCVYEPLNGMDLVVCLIDVVLVNKVLIFMLDDYNLIWDVLELKLVSWKHVLA